MVKRISAAGLFHSRRVSEESHYDFILLTRSCKSLQENNIIADFRTIMEDPYFPISKLNAYYLLTLLYTCVSHAWLAIGSRKGREMKLSIAPESKKIPKKLAIVTGANTGIGFETAKRLVREYGWDVILACRTKDKALAARNAINNCDGGFDGDTRSHGKAIVLYPVLDLSDFSSIRRFVCAVQEKFDNVDVLINNAGRNTSGRSPGNPELDLLFQSNYLGHFLLTELLLKDELLLSSAKNRSDGIGNKVINLSSVMHHFSKGDVLEGKRFESIASPSYWKRRALYSEKDAPKNIYSASKLAAILHCIELNRKYNDKNLTAIAVNPGATNSEIWRAFPRWVRRYVFEKIYLTTEQGSEPVIAAAVRDDLAVQMENDSTSSGHHSIIYLQPYANPFSIFGGRWFVDSSSTTSGSDASSQQGPMNPCTEMLGPYVGHLPTIPRLPTQINEAAETLWKVSRELTKL